MNATFLDEKIVRGVEEKHFCSDGRGGFWVRDCPPYEHLETRNHKGHQCFRRARRVLPMQRTLAPSPRYLSEVGLQRGAVQENENL